MIVEIETEPQNQYPLLPTGCEVTATSILLNSLVKSHNLNIGTYRIKNESLADRIIKEQDPDPITKFCGNPYRAFIGSPYSKESFGVFHQPIYNLIKEVIYEDYENQHIEVIDLTQTNVNKFKYLIKPNETKDYIQSRLDYFENDNNSGNNEDDFDVLKNHMIFNNTPIIIWMTLELKQPKITDEWLDCKNESQPLYWVSPQHCATLSGFDEVENVVIITDPHTGKIERYNKNLFLKRWRQLGRQAVSIKFK
ncbi:hypothetical protein ACTA71_010033 [Dictyostelium dimigraforme]